LVREAPLIDRGDGLRADLLRKLPAASLILDEDGRRLYETDWRGIVTNPSEAVLLPKNTDEAATMVRICVQHGVAVVPQGGNTGLVAGAVPIANRSQAILNLRRMRRIRSIDRINATMIVESGASLAEAKLAAEDADMLLPVALASEGSSQIGGVIATNAGGVQVLAYGSMRRQVLGVEVILPDGRVWNGLRTLRKDNTGIDLKQLFIGSEGILGIVTAAALQLLPRPRRTATVLLAVPSLRRALDVFVETQALFGNELTSCEFLTAGSMELLACLPRGASNPFDTLYPAYLLVEVSVLDPDRDPLPALQTILMRHLEAGTVLDAIAAQSEAQRSQLWTLREDISESEKLQGGAVKHDIAVPIAAIPGTVDAIEANLLKVFPSAGLNVFGHLGDGNLHINVLPPKGVALSTFYLVAGPITRMIEQVAVDAGGTFSAEHGVGQLRVRSLSEFRAPLELELMRTIKRALDPQWLLNPGKVIDRGEP
jgi:FAD/FMN-containing dehydrogenase